MAVKTYAPEGAGPWELEVDWAGTSDLDPGQREGIPFTVQKADTNLELFYLGVTQILGQGRIIPGRLVLNNGNPGNLDLSELEISASISNNTNPTTTFNFKLVGRHKYIVYYMRSHKINLKEDPHVTRVPSTRLSIFSS